MGSLGRELVTSMLIFHCNRSEIVNLVKLKGWRMTIPFIRYMMECGETRLLTVSATFYIPFSLKYCKLQL